MGLGAFTCIARTAINLDPTLNADNVVQALHAAKMYMIKGLMEECEYYLRTCISPESVLTVMTTCLILNMTLAEDLEVGYWAMLFENSGRALKSPSFVSAHGDIIVR